MNATDKEVYTVSFVRVIVECLDTTHNVFKDITDRTINTN